MKRGLPNKGMELTAYSVRSAPAFGSRSYLALAQLQWPEPRCASCPTGVSVNGTNKFGIDAIRKDVLVPEPWDALVKPLNV